MQTVRKVQVQVGPLERKWYNRLFFILTGAWPEKVALERAQMLSEASLATAEAYASEHACHRCGGELAVEPGREPTEPVIFCVECGEGGVD